MRLSDAIALGRVFIQEPDATRYCKCAIGMAAASLKGEEYKDSSDALRAAVHAWPWILGFTTLPDAPWAYQYEHVISLKFADVMMGRMTLEQLIDYVRSVEPEEEAAMLQAELESEYACT